MGLYQTGKSQSVELADFGPDLDPASPSQGVGILLDMDKAFPTLKGYQALNLPQPFVAEALPEKPTGGTIAYFSDGSTQEFAGGANHLWRAYNGTWVQADQQGTTPFAATSPWSFAQFNDDVIAVAAGVAPQVATGQFGVFTPLGGSPPLGAVAVLSINAQVIMFAGPAWYASALGTDDNWTPDIQTQAGTGTLYDYPGDVVACAPIYRNAIAFKNTAAWLGSYVGGQAIWSWQLISDLTGTWGQGSLMVLPEAVFLLGSDDFYSITGYAPVRIPNNLKEWFFDTADPTALASTQSRYDPYHGVCWWYFVSKTPAVAGQPDRYVNYNIRAQRWGTGYLQTPCVLSPNTQPGVINGLYFDQNYILQSYTGAPDTMRLLTGYFGQDGLLGQIMRVRPRYNITPARQSLQTFHTDTIGLTDTAGQPGVLGADGWFYFRNYDRWHRWQLTVGGMNQAVEPNEQAGCEVSAFSYEYREGGIR